jgi:hypothetical protein
MADAVARFSLELDSNAGQVAGDQARALSDLQQKIQGDTAALREMQKALRNLQGGSVVNIQVARDLKDRIAAQKATIASATQSYIKMGGTFRDVQKGGKEASSGLKDLTQAAQGAGGPLGRLASGLGSLGKYATLAGGLVAVAAAIAAVTAAAVAGTAALLKFGIGVANARRNELLHLEALGKLRYGYLGLAYGFQPVADKASFLQSTIDNVTASVALSREQVAGYAEDLYRTGLRGGNLQAALSGVAITAATQGEAAAGAFKGMALSAGLAGKSIRALSDDVKARLGGIAAAQLLSLDVQSRKLRENFAMIFSGLKIDKLLNGVKQITDLFSQSSASGRALKAIVEGLFGPLIDQVSGPASLLVKRFFQGMIIAALQVGIVILKLRNWFRDTFGDTKLFKNLNLMSLAVTAGKIAIYGLVGAVAVAGVVLANLAALILLPYAAIGLLAYGLYRGVKAVGALGEAAYDAGGQIVKGLVEGIKSGANWVIQAIENLGTSAMKAFRAKLGIASPSRVAMRSAIEVPRGVSAGIYAGRPAVHRAVQSLVAIPQRVAGPRPIVSIPTEHHEQGQRDQAGFNAPPARGPSIFGSYGNPPAPAQARLNAPSVTIGEIHVHASSNEPEALGEAVKVHIYKLLAGTATELGGALP